MRSLQTVYESFKLAMIAVLFVVIVVAAVWSAVILFRGSLLGGCLLVLLAGACFGHDLFNLPVGPVPLTTDRLLWVVLLIQCLVWRRMGLTERRPLGGAELVLYALVGVLLVSALSHDWHAHHNQPAARLVFYYLMPLGLYWVARQIRLSERSAMALLACLGLFGLYLAVTALAETNQWWWLVYPKYIKSSTYTEFLGRARGPLLNPIGTGLLLTVGLAGALMWWPRLNRAGRVVLLVGALVICLGIYCTLTRSVWLGAGLGLFLLFALTVPRSWRVAVLGSMLLVAALAGATQWQHILAFKRDRDLSAKETAESVKLRPILAMVAWNMFQDRPLAGCGFGQYAEQSVSYLADRSSGLTLQQARGYGQHNVFLSLLSETGLLGLGLFFLLLALWTRDAWKVWRAAAAPAWARRLALVFLVLLANYGVNGIFHDLSLIFMVQMLLFFLAGLTAGLRPYGGGASGLRDGRFQWFAYRAPGL